MTVAVEGSARESRAGGPRAAVRPLFSINDHVPSSLFRHSAWASWKEASGWTRIEEPRSLASPRRGLSLLTRPVEGVGTMAFAPGSPSAELLAMFGHRPEAENRGAALEELSFAVRGSLPDDCVFLRWDLHALAWEGAEDARLAEIRMNASTGSRPFRKAPREYCALDTMIVDLGGGPSAVEGRMQYRARYAARLAERRGISVDVRREEGLESFHALHVKTATLRGLSVHGLPAFASLFRAAERGSLDLSIYAATVDGRDAASAVIARHGGEAWYLFAASDPGLREYCGPTAVLKRAIMDCVAAGGSRMDLMGVAPEGDRAHPFAGLSLFKSGFGGERRKRAGAWDFVIRPEAYERCVSFERVAIA